MSDVAISIDGISKQYRLGEFHREGTLVGAIARTARRLLRRGTPSSGKDPGSLWALKDISFEVRVGEVVGIIGRNGSGKSTLLKILSRITAPTAGRARLWGRVGSLLEVGTGFHPELTGRENVFLNGTMLGMSPHDIRARFDEIVDFAEIERFIDTPVKRYSSGMYTRLAFAVAAYLDPEILIVDEVLAVGDAAFQKKCLNKIGSMTQVGRTVLFVSHNMGSIAELCSRAVLLHAGEMHDIGPTARVIEAYVGLAGGTGRRQIVADDSAFSCSLTAIELSDATGERRHTFDLNEEIVIEITYRARAAVEGFQVTVSLARNLVDLVHSFHTDGMDEIPATAPGLYKLTYRLPGGFLKAGTYTARVATGTPDRLMQDFEAALTFDIEELTEDTMRKGYRRDRPGHVVSPGKWTTVRIG